MDDRVAFTFHDCLGAGGFGEVYHATQHLKSGIQRSVAVKVLKSEFEEGSDAVKRLRDEGQILAMLKHPSILNVHHFTHIDGRVALITEYVEGIDVASVCIPGSLMPTNVALTVVAQIADALHFAWHTKNPNTGKELRLIHRDIKPENIRVSVTGEVKLLDFGIARSTEMKRRARTAVGDVLMTPGYGAPEALTFGVTSPAVDVYALGATLYRMLTGEKLFEAKPLSFQVSLAMDTVDYKEFLEERIDKIEDAQARELVGDMLTHNPDHRPRAVAIRDRAEDIADRLKGPSVLRYMKSLDLPEVNARGDGPLEGKTVTASGLIKDGELPRRSSKSLPPPPPDLVTGTINPADGRPASLPPPPPPPASAVNTGTIKPSIAQAETRVMQASLPPTPVGDLTKKSMTPVSMRREPMYTPTASKSLPPRSKSLPPQPAPSPPQPAASSSGTSPIILLGLAMGLPLIGIGLIMMAGVLYLIFVG